MGQFSVAVCLPSGSILEYQNHTINTGRANTILNFEFGSTERSTERSTELTPKAHRRLNFELKTKDKGSRFKEQGKKQRCKVKGDYPFEIPAFSIRS